MRLRTSPLNHLNTKRYEVGETKPNTALQNITRTSDSDKATIRTKPVQDSDACSYSVHNIPKENAAPTGVERDVLGNTNKSAHPHNTTIRLEAASVLAHAIAECDPRDAVVIMSAALSDLSPGGPLPVFENAQSDADFWADLAAPFEIEAYFKATLERLKNLALGIKSRKRVFLNLWESFPETDRMAFINKVDPHGKFVGRVN